MPRDFVTIVSGLPRSGTSLMMQMLGGGGMPLLTDGVRLADEDNPRGYFEFEPVKRTKTDSAWLADARGKAVKMVYLLLRDLPPAHSYRVILMRRDLQEVVASQGAMLQRTGKAGAGLSEAQMAGIFAREMTAIAQWLRSQPNFTVLEVEHSACLRSPREVANALNAFVGGGLDESAMAAAVDPALYRRSRISAVLS